MALQNLRARIILILITILLLIIKLFTAVIILSDDPTNFLVFRLSPSFNNDIIASSINTNEYIILMTDENGFIGDGIYYFITQYLWWWVSIPALFLSILNFGKLLTKSSSRC